MNNLPPDQSQLWLLDFGMDNLVRLSPGASIRAIMGNEMGKRVADTALLDTATCNGMSGRITGQMLIVELVDLWWLVGYGVQLLYNVTIQIQDSNEMTLVTVSKRTDFRTIVLDQLPITGAKIVVGIAPGSGWDFEINGHEIFRKGSNLAPPDASELHEKM